MTINSLIHRMTGHATRDEATVRFRAEPAPDARAKRPRDEDLDQTERERVDIPAFLRRQAN
jgi:hypothetical protein